MISKTSDQIKEKIKRLEELEAEYPAAIKAKTQTQAAYDLEMAKTILRLKNGDINEFEGQACGVTPISIIEKIAKGICWEGGLACSASDMQLKALESKIKIAQAQLNGYQSIFRHLAEN